MRRVADSAVIQTQLVLNSHLNGAGRLFAGSWWNDEKKYAWKIALRMCHILPVKTAKRFGKAAALIRYHGCAALAKDFARFCRKQRNHG